MTTDIMIALALTLTACTKPDLLSASPPSVAAAAPPDVRAACDLASYRCSQCHDLGRIADLHLDRAADWRGYVKRMRRMPGSNIAPDEETPIVTCLVFRDLGLSAARAEAAR